MIWSLLSVTTTSVCTRFVVMRTISSGAISCCGFWGVLGVCANAAQKTDDKLSTRAMIRFMMIPLIVSDSFNYVDNYSDGLWGWADYILFSRLITNLCEAVGLIFQVT